MSKSRQTSGKKERERQKQKHRLEKERRREDRKANSKSGPDSMIAYVNEYGQLSDTPPDPNKIRAVKAEDIQIAVPKQKPPDPNEAIRRGTLLFFNHDKGYGFIKDDLTQENIFVHASGMLEEIKENGHVSFETEKGPRGPAAVKVKNEPLVKG